MGSPSVVYVGFFLLANFFSSSCMQLHLTYYATSSDTFAWMAATPRTSGGDQKSFFFRCRWGTYTDRRGENDGGSSN